MSTAPPRDALATGRRLAPAATLDALSIIAFAAAGRRSHGGTGDALSGTLTVAAPFLIGLVAAWVITRAWRRPAALVTGAAIWPLTVALGMVLRTTLFDRGAATSFVLVASAVTGALLLGWRAVWRLRSCS